MHKPESVQEIEMHKIFCTKETRKESGGNGDQRKNWDHPDYNRLWYCWDLFEYLEESWRAEEICGHSNFSENYQHEKFLGYAVIEMEQLII